MARAPGGKVLSQDSACSLLYQEYYYDQKAAVGLREQTKYGGCRRSTGDGAAAACQSASPPSGKSSPIAARACSGPVPHADQFFSLSQSSYFSDDTASLLSSSCDSCISRRSSTRKSRRNLQRSLFPLRIIGQQLKESLTRVKNAQRDVTSQGEDAERSIRSFFAETISRLEQERDNLLARSSGLVREKLAALRQQEETVSRATSEVQNMVEYCKRNTESANDEDLLTLHNDLRDRIQNECSRQRKWCKEDPCEVADIAVQVTGVEEIVQLCREKVRVYTFPNSTASLVQRAEVGEESMRCVMEPWDPLFTPHTTSLTATLVSVVDGSKMKGLVTPVGRGLYEVRYTPQVRGRHQLHVTRDGKSISGSPLPVMATISPSLLGTPVHTMGPLKHPYSAVFDPKNQLFVTESGGNCIQKYKRSGDKVVGEVFTSSRQLKAPTGMAIDSEGFSYVVNTSTHTLSKLNQDGVVVKEVGREGSERDDFNHPTGLALMEDNKIFVCDRKNDRIKIYSTDLVLLGTFGRHGSGEGELNWPYDIACDEEHQLVYVADSDNHRIQVFGTDGKYRCTLGGPGTSREPGTLARPAGICLGGDGRLYVTEFANHRVSVFDRDGVFQGGFGSYGSEPGQFCYPVGITSDGDGFLYVCDQGNNRVQVF